MTKTFLAALWLVLAAPAMASDDHDHGPAAAPTATAPALPRFSTATDLFEVVGIVDGTRLVVYVDRFADNAPVQGAKVALEVGATKVALTERAPGEFEGTLASAPATGTTAVTATITAGSDTDILAAELEVGEAPHDDHAHPRNWQRTAGWAGGALVLLAVVVLGGRALMTRRKGAAA